jgi:hypothetical protein
MVRKACFVASPERVADFAGAISHMLSQSFTVMRGHSRSKNGAASLAKTWMAGTSPAMTNSFTQVE